MADEDNNVKVPLKWRMKAWWEGYDLDDIKARLNRGEEDPFVDDEAETEDNQDGDDTPSEALIWDDKRLETTQLIWGEGYC